MIDRKRYGPIQRSKYSATTNAHETKLPILLTLENNQNTV